MLFKGLEVASMELRHVEIPVMNIKQCIRAHLDANSSIPVLPNKNICAGGVKGFFKYFQFNC